MPFIFTVVTCAVLPIRIYNSSSMHSSRFGALWHIQTLITQENYVLIFGAP